MLRLLMTMLALCLVLGAVANNVRIRGEARIQPLGKNSTTAVITFPLSWEHSWRQNECWDAVYLFMKYRRKGVNEPWHHAFLKKDPKAHTAGGGGTVPPMEFFPSLSEIDPWLNYDEVIWSNYQASTPRVTEDLTTGLFLFRKTLGAGDISIPRVSLQWEFTKGDLNLYYPGLTAEEILNDKLEVSIQAIEMVFVPNGPYYVGDAQSYFSFVGTDKASQVVSSFYIASDDKMVLQTMGKSTGYAASSWEIPEGFPIGYNGFYTMKYEVSQEQYVNFLNRLTYQDQKKRIGNNLDNLQVGEFAFGPAIGAPSFRNGIVLEHHYRDNSTPAVFGFDLNGDDPLNSDTDGRSIPCNYLTAEDLRAYADWMGLRPHSEMEYEKAGRERNPEESTGYALRGFAWGTHNWAPLSYWNPTTIKEANTEEEYVELPNADMTGRLNGPRYHGTGPVRCGAFATPTSDIYQSGASKWGVMEMTGNLAEVYYNAYTGKAFNGQVYGDGNIWSSVVTWRDTTVTYREYVGSYYHYWYYHYRPRINKVIQYPDVINRFNRPLSIRILWEYYGSWEGDSITYSVTLPWPVQVWPKAKESFILRGGSFMTPNDGTAEITMALSNRGDDTYQTTNADALRLPHTGFRAGADIPLQPMKYIGLIAGANGLQRDTAVVCEGNPYTFLELTAGDDQEEFSLYSWEMKDAGGNWTVVSGSNVKELTLSCCMVDKTLMHEYTFRRRSIASHAEAYGREVTLIVPGYQVNGGATDLTIGRADTKGIDLTTLLGVAGDVTVEWVKGGTEGTLYSGTGKITHAAEINRADLPADVAQGGVCQIRVTVSMGGCEFVEEYTLHIQAPTAACPAFITGASGTKYEVATLADGKCWTLTNLNETVNGETGAYTWATMQMNGVCPEGFWVAAQSDWDLLWSFSSVYMPIYGYDPVDCDPANMDYLASGHPCLMGGSAALYNPGLQKFVEAIKMNGSTGDWWAKRAGNSPLYVSVVDFTNDESNIDSMMSFAGGTTSTKKAIRCVNRPGL